MSAETEHDPVPSDGPLPRFRAGPTPRTRPQSAIVVGWDAHRPSTAALTYAVMLAQSLAAHIHVVHIVDVDDLPVDPDAAEWEHDVDDAFLRVVPRFRGRKQLCEGGRWIATEKQLISERSAEFLSTQNAA